MHKPTPSTDMNADPSQVSPFVKFFSAIIFKVIKPNFEREWDGYGIFTPEMLYFYFESRIHGNEQIFILY